MSPRRNSWIGGHPNQTVQQPPSFRRRGSVLVASVILITIAGLAVVSWLMFINDGARSAGRARSQAHAFYAAEAGVERVVDYFNNPSDFAGTPPDEYDEYETHPPAYLLSYPIQPAAYGFFEPYILDYAKDSDGKPINSDFEEIWDESGRRIISGEEPIITRFTYFRNSAGADPATVSLTSKIVSMQLDAAADSLLVMRDENGREQARVVSLEVQHPSELSSEELALATAERPIVCKVVAVGEANGVRVTVETMLTEIQSPFFHSPAAIISEAAVEFSGNFNVYWGEVWAHEDINLDNAILKKLPRLDPDNPDFEEPKGKNLGNDPWFRMRTEGVFKQGSKYADGREYDGFANSPISKLSNEDVYYMPYDADFLGKKKGKLNPDFVNRENLTQNSDLQFPHYDYDQWKEYFLAYDLPYYWTDTSGNIYGKDRDPDSNTFGQIVSKSYGDWFSIDPDDPDYNNYTDQFAFIDSVPVDNNGNPAPLVDGIPVLNSTYFPRNPAEPIARIPTIKVSGQSLHTRGVMLSAANMNMTGQGNPPRSDELLDENGNRLVLMPNGDEPPDEFKVFHNGFLYSWGTLAGGGNRTFYGSVYAVGGFGASGTPSVYYNVKMKDGSWLNVNQSRVRRNLWAVENGGAPAAEGEET
ncbi:MAG: hypothetical protein PWP23_2589 [Candidatus Sumerlaeota bacterium]|nr:hypothetical protein [Candidatus Sumerlaeota bacterium]